ncbi:NAD(P)-dependent oxidoreductase [Nocardia crassostreae]|uniref:NAD(P)-dependent oxidoreductase n=1 Tax=Nocardia crassostreae TaxID=53428 RepID=UPI00082D255C|nr:NAD(P)-binding domain-containing protein [Nocardia crassostreae]
MTNTQYRPVALLGLGAMGQAMAAALVKAGVPTTVWNRSAGKAGELVAAGAVEAVTVAEAVRGTEVVIAVLLDHASVHQTLDPVVGELAGKHLINLTSTAPEESRELARWAAGHGIGFADGGIMAVPPMIGSPGAEILYSGTESVVEAHRDVLELFGAAEFLGEDAGLAAILDFALLTNMYLMFSGFFQGAALAGTAGISATRFGERAAAWLTAMTHGLPEYGKAIDAGDYSAEVQYLAFQKAAVDAIVRAHNDAGVATDFISPVQQSIDRQVQAGHSGAAFTRTIEELR